MENGHSQLCGERHISDPIGSPNPVNTAATAMEHRTVNSLVGGHGKYNTNDEFTSTKGHYADPQRPLWKNVWPWPPTATKKILLCAPSSVAYYFWRRLTSPRSRPGPTRRIPKLC